MGLVVPGHASTFKDIILTSDQICDEIKIDVLPELKNPRDFDGNLHREIFFIDIEISKLFEIVFENQRSHRKFSSTKRF